MYRVPAGDFLEWAEGNDLRYLPKGFTIMTRVKLVAAKGIPEYLKRKEATGFTMAPRYPKNWLFLVNVTLEAMFKIRKKGWVPETVEVFIRWEPKR